MKKRPLFHENHPSPVTRRDFLAQGFAAYGAYTMMPTVLGMIASEHAARAAGLACPTAGAKNGALPFLVFDGAGGFATAGNWLGLDATGNIMPAGSYGRMGLGSGVPAADTTFGAPMATSASKILAAMKAAMSPACQAVTRMGTFVHVSQSDTEANLSSAIGYVSSFGLQGSMISSPLGNGSNSTSGGNSGSPYTDPTLRPLKVSSLNTVLNTVNYQGALKGLPAQALKAMAKAASNLSASQSAKLSGMTLGDQMSTLAQCGFLNNQGIANTGANTAVDPRLDPVMQALYGITATSSTGDPKVVLATLVYNTVKGYTGPSCIQIGGCDYHDGTQTTGDTKDTEIGTDIGLAVQAAFNLGTPLVFQILSDGNTISDQDTRVWRSDTNTHSQTLLGIMDPKGARNMTRHQIGAFVPSTSGANVDTTTLIGGDPQRATAAVFANYLNLVGGNALAALDTYVAPGSLGSDITPLLLFS